MRVNATEGEGTGLESEGPVVHCGVGGTNISD